VLDAAVEALLDAGFTRPDIDQMASIDKVREKIGDSFVVSEELAEDVPLVPRQTVVLASASYRTTCADRARMPRREAPAPSLPFDYDWTPE
jgi:hypothetical protein